VLQASQRRIDLAPLSKAHVPAIDAHIHAEPDGVRDMLDRQPSDLAAEKLLVTTQSLEDVSGAVHVIECRPQAPILTQVRRALGSPPRKKNHHNRRRPARIGGRCRRPGSTHSSPRRDQTRVVGRTAAQSLWSVSARLVVEPARAAREIERMRGAGDIAMTTDRGPQMAAVV
jgi:hypothetical protein